MPDPIVHNPKANAIARGVKQFSNIEIIAGEEFLVLEISLREKFIIPCKYIYPWDGHFDMAKDLVNSHAMIM